MEQMSPETAGQARLGLRLPQILQRGGVAEIWASTSLIIDRDGTNRADETIGREGMQRVDLFIKVEVELDEEEKPERVAGEICRQIEKIYVVRAAELSSIVSQD